MNNKCLSLFESLNNEENEEENEVISQKMETFMNNNPEFVQKYDDFINAYIEIQTKEGEMLREMLQNMTNPYFLFSNKIKEMENELLKLIYPALIICEELEAMDEEINWGETFENLSDCFYDFESLIRETKTDIIKRQAERIKLPQNCVSEIKRTMW